MSLSYYFAQYNFRTSTLANGFAPSWIRPDTVELDLKKDHIWDIWIRRILNFTADNKGEGSEN